MMMLSIDDLARVHGGAQLDPRVPGQRRDTLLATCGPQIDAYTRTRQAFGQDRTNTRAEIDMVTAGRSLALCATNAGFDPPPEWRAAAGGSGRR